MFIVSVEMKRCRNIWRCDRERETGTGRLGKVADPGNVLEEDDQTIRRKRNKGEEEEERGKTVTLVHGYDEGGIHRDPPEPDPF